MVEVARLQVSLTLEDKVTRGLEQATRKLDETHQAMTKVGLAMTAIGAAGVAGFGSAIKAASDFDAAMSNIQAVLGAPEWAEFGTELDTLAKKLGKDTVFSAKEAAEAIEELVKAGVSTKDILGGAAEAVTSLAAAGGVSIKEAAEIAANASNVFEIAGTDMAKTADTIAGAVNASALSMNDFRFALAMSGSVAKSAGQTFEETATALAALGQAGLKGSDAGTSLKTFLVSLTPASKTAAAAMRELGIITAEGANQFFTTSGAAKSLTEVSGILKRALDGLSDQKRIELLHDAFGTDAMRAAAILGRQGAEGMREMADAMSKVTANEVAKTKLDNLAGSMKQLAGSIETVQITIGQKLTPAIKGLADLLTGMVNAFLELPEGIQNTIVAVAGAVTVFAALGGPILLLAGAIPAITQGFAFLLPAVAAVAAPVALLAAAVAALAAAWVTDWQGIRTTTMTMLENIQPAVEHLGEVLGQLAKGVGDAFDALGRQLSAFWTALTGESADGAAAMTDAGNQIIRWFHDDLVPAVDAGKLMWEAFWTAVNDSVIAAFNAVLPSLQALSAWYRDELTPVLDTARERWTAFWDEVGPTITAAWAVAQPILAAIAAWYRETLGKALDIARDALAAWIGGFQTALRTIADALGPVAELIGGKAQEINRALQRGLAEMGPGSEEATKAVLRSVQGQLELTDAEVEQMSHEIGTDMALGIARGVEGATPAMLEAVRASARQAVAIARQEAAAAAAASTGGGGGGGGGGATPLVGSLGGGFGAIGLGSLIGGLYEPPPMISSERRGRRIIVKDKFTGIPRYEWDDTADMDEVERWRHYEELDSRRPPPWRIGGRVGSLGDLTGGLSGGSERLFSSTTMGGDGAELTSTFTQAATAATAFLGVQQSVTRAVRDMAPAVASAANVFSAYTAQAQEAAVATASVGMAAGGTGYGGVADPGYAAYQLMMRGGNYNGQVGSGFGGGGSPYYPSYDTGGYVDRTGLALVHAGEVVLTPEQAGTSGGGRGYGLGPMATGPGPHQMASAGPQIYVTIQSPPALITPTSQLELRATAEKLAPMVADALQRSGRLRQV